VHVCLVSDLYGRPEPTGIGVYLERVLEHLPRTFPESTFTALAWQESNPPIVPPGPNLRYVQVRGDTKVSWAKWLLRGVGPDVDRLTSGVQVVHALHPLPANARVPWVTTVHDISPVMFPTQYSRTNRFKFARSMQAVVRRGAHVIAISQTTADDLRRVYDMPESRITVVRYGIDAQRLELGDAARASLTARYQLPRRFLLFVGNLNRRKNLVVLVHAFAKVAAEIPDVDLVLAGSDGFGADEVRAAIAADGVAGRVHLPGYTDHDDALGLMAMSEAFVFPTLYEGFGLPPLEAMVQGAPVVAAAGGSVPEIVGDAALITDPADVDGLAANLVKVVTEPHLRATLIERGYARAATFTWDKMARETYAVYESLAG
jgi:glycosyltransferase involved in cell wall biosynthesis